MYNSSVAAKAAGGTMSATIKADGNEVSVKDSAVVVMLSMS